MTTFYYKNDKKVSLNPEKRQRICSEINNEFKQFYRDLSEPKEEATSILSELLDAEDREDYLIEDDEETIPYCVVSSYESTMENVEC